MKKIFIAVLAVCLLGTLVQANDQREVVVSKFKKQPKTIRPLSITKFELTDKNGDTKIIDLKGQKIIVVSVSEPGSEGKSYAVDEDGTIWWVDDIASGAYGGHETPTGIFHVLLKRRYHMSAAHPSPDGKNNMDFEMLFTQDGIALHLGNTRALSHGCIHVGRKDVEAMFKWVEVGTKVIVMRGNYGQLLNQELEAFKRDIKAYDRTH
ncbi:MAG: L,D-transpeptidase [Sulfurovum sp.]|uniref:L,D-transpeptidase n=1 Tax=Sulfurovum sp. TaxID=1969726 RepID=UPI003C7580C8